MENKDDKKGKEDWDAEEYTRFMWRGKEMTADEWRDLFAQAEEEADRQKKSELDWQLKESLRLIQSQKRKKAEESKYNNGMADKSPSQSKVCGHNAGKMHKWECAECFLTGETDLYVSPSGRHIWQCVDEKKTIIPISNFCGEHGVFPCPMCRTESKVEVKGA